VKKQNKIGCGWKWNGAPQPREAREESIGFTDYYLSTSTNWCWSLQFGNPQKK
jgi:hypothetical protein